MDITYVPMEKGYMYFLTLIDLKSRFTIGWSLSKSMETSWVVCTLTDAIRAHGLPEIINTHKGSQFTSFEYIEFVKRLKRVSITMDCKGRSIDNVLIERYCSTIKYEKLYLLELQNGRQVLEVCEEFINYYNHRRDHSSIGGTPAVKIYNKAA